MRDRTTAEAFVALLLGALLLVFGSTLSDDAPTEPDTRASSYVSDVRGTRGLYEVLLAVGARPDRLVRAPAALESTAQTLVIAAPSEPFLRSDVAALLDWVARGGRVLIAGSPPRPPKGTSFHRVLLDHVGLRTRVRAILSEAATPLPGSGLDTLLALDWPTGLVLEPAPKGTESKTDARAGEPRRLVGTRSLLLAAAVPFGDAGGEVVVLADVSLLENEFLRRVENAALLVDLLLARDSDGGRVLFDEFHHGFRPDGERDGLTAQATALLASTWPGRGLLVLIAAWVVLLLGRVPRLGRPLPAAPPPRRALSEHADALGRLLDGARARDAALRMLTAGARRAVGPRSGLPAGLTPREFHTRLGRSPARGAEELGAALTRAETLDAQRDGELASAARELAAARRRYLHGGD